MARAPGTVKGMEVHFFAFSSHLHILSSSSQSRPFVHADRQSMLQIWRQRHNQAVARSLGVDPQPLAPNKTFEFQEPSEKINGERHRIRGPLNYQGAGDRGS